MSIVSVLILVVVAISIVWAFKTGYIKALSERVRFLVYPLDSWWSWGNSLNLKDGE